METTSQTTANGQPKVSSNTTDGNVSEPVEIKTKTAILVATPMRALTGFAEQHAAFLAELAALSTDDTCPYEFIQAVVTGGRTWGRCQMIANARKLKAKLYPNLKWIYWHDDDVEQTAAGLLRLLSHKLPVVGAMYTVKGKDPHWCANFLHEVELQKNGLLQVYELAIGALLTHIEVYDHVEKKFPAILYTDRNTGERHNGYFQEVVIERVPYSEDYFFCWLLRHTGIGIFADTELKLKHRGSDGKLWPEEWPPIPIDEVAKEATD